jgi:hypothetical protein
VKDQVLAAAKPGQDARWPNGNVAARLALVMLSPAFEMPQIEKV